MLRAMPLPFDTLLISLLLLRSLWLWWSSLPPQDRFFTDGPSTLSLLNVDSLECTLWVEHIMGFGSLLQIDNRSKLLKISLISIVGSIADGAAVSTLFSLFWRIFISCSRWNESNSPIKLFSSCIETSYIWPVCMCWCGCRFFAFDCV